MIKLVGMVRGSYSELQRDYPNDGAVMEFNFKDLEEIAGFVLPEWIFKLYVNGRRIANPKRYLERKGIWKYCLRNEEGESYYQFAKGGITHG